MYQFVESITDTDTDAHSHTQTHTWFDQGQPTIQLILLVIELIQEVKTTHFSWCFNYTSSKWLIFQIEINKFFLTQFLENIMSFMVWY